ncbi:hypothetical protein [Microbacterium sp. bgisy203]|uniref:hypothetical protein n=1 Tax=Microbacterium sp. bgisy203 TaxID=3413799 RepID=UPI003D75B629
MAAENTVNTGKDAVDGAVEKTKEAYERITESVGGALNSEQAEQISDTILDTVTGFAKKILPDSADSQIDEVRRKVDEQIGTEK